jgi:hypothetical protein
MLVSWDWCHRCESVSADPIYSFAGAHPAAADDPAENDWRAAIEERLASLESEIAELRASQRP